MKKFTYLWLLSFVFLAITGCKEEEEAQPAVAELIKGSWNEVKAVRKDLNETGELISEVETDGTMRYVLDGQTLTLGTPPDARNYSYTLSEKNGQTTLTFMFLGSVSHWDIEVVSQNELIFRETLPSPNHKGEMVYTTIYASYLQRR
ncbi:hypothetical protein ACFSC6_01980 [Rufibacter sediminis]|uniref:Lipocalin-like domain-containing protein n=1 Tax=Rufibacter sediminis TaxID=2762756 RepID=A0ABR6VXK5_9BACT|nr:hypothetical protein [Rufibacter sediminis]MBC3541659.1 hypothetical protein [Rufibacter sediminis]